MGKDVKAERKATKPSSSARAAEVLAGKAAGAGGFGFGGFVGGTPIAANVPGFAFGGAAAARVATPSAGDSTGAAAASDLSDVPLTAQVDGELAQCIRHLTKKDPTTKTKALQNLRALIPTRSLPDLLSAFPPWAFMYRRLILDPSRAVRSETAATLAVLLASVGKSVAPHLKGLMGPWWLAMYDPYAEAASASRAAFAAAFPPRRRQVDAVLYCRTELMAYLIDRLAATPQQLGDARKDSPEELEERHERVQAACLAGLAALVEMLTEVGATTAGDAAAAAATGGGEGGTPDTPSAGSEASGSGGPAAAAAGTATGGGGEQLLLAAVREVLCKQGFWKGATGAKPAPVRRAAYGLARCVAQHAPGLLEGCAAEAAGCVLGALGEKEPGNHGAMWEAVLTYGKACPGAWRHVNMRKMLLPRLYSLLRHGCYGSAASSLPALLPLLPLLPAGTLGPSPDVLVALLESVWTGMADPAASSRPAKAASGAAYRECLTWGLLNSARLAAADAASPAAADAAAAYCRALLAGSLQAHVVPAALKPGPPGDAAADLVAGLLVAVAAAAGRAGDSGAAGSTPPAATALACVVDCLRASVAAALQQAVSAADAAEQDGGALAAACEGTTALLACLKRSAQACGDAVASVAAAAASGLLSAGVADMPPAASQMLSTLLREYGVAGLTAARAAPLEGEAEAPAAPASAALGSFSLDSLVTSFTAGPVTGPSAEAAADLLVAFCHSHDDLPALWEQVVAAALGPAQEQQQQQPAGLQRCLLLLRRCATAAAAERPGRQGPEAGASGSGWAPPSPSLDAVAQRIAESWGTDATGAEGEQDAGSAVSARPDVALLATALGANAAGRVMLGRAAAERVLSALSGHLEVSLSSPGSPQAAAAAHVAALALVGPLRQARCELWALLPDAACAAVQAVAQQAWRSRHAAHAHHVHAGGAAAAAAPGEASSEEASEEGEEAEDAGSDAEGHDAHRRTAVSDSEEDDEEAADAGAREGDEDVREDGAAPARSGAVLLATHAARAAAAACWAGGAPVLAAAAALLPRARTDELVLQLAALLAAAVPPAAQEPGEASPARTPALGGSLQPRAWARTAAQLLAAVPCGAAQQQAALERLLAAQPQWRTWSGAAAGGSGAGGSAPEWERGATVAASVEYLARLVDGAGPAAVLGTAAGEDEEEEAGAAADGASGGRAWVLVELLRAQHAIAAAEAEAEAARDGEDDDDDDDSDGASSSSGSQQPPALPSAACRRAVGRAAEALLRHAVYGAVDEVKAGEDAGGTGGRFGGLLRSVVDDLAEGCRGSEGAAGPAEGALAGTGARDLSELPPRQAVFLDALCHVASRVDRASPPDSHAAGGSDRGDGPPPLLPHQQRLCRHWLATCRPDGAASTGLPPRALLRLLPLVAGPLRRAAAAAAGAGSSSSHRAPGAAGAAAADAVLAASGLSELSAAWVRHCLSRPSVLLEGSRRDVVALDTAVACFPVPESRDGSVSGGSGAAAAAAAGALARSSGAALAQAEQPLLMQLVRHEIVRQAAMAAARRQPGGSEPSPAPHAAPGDAARATVTRLAHAAVVYYWRGLAQPDWHALLQDVQEHLQGAAETLAECLAQLAAAARDAAGQLLSLPADAERPGGAMALQLLRRLGQRGVLARVEQGRVLAAEAEAAVGACSVGPAAQAAAQLAAVLAELQDEVALAGGGGSAAGAAAAAREYGAAVSACWTLCMQLAVLLGGVECFAAACGPAAEASVGAWVAAHRGFWAAVARCSGRALMPGREDQGGRAVAAAVAAVAPRLASAGLDAAGALLGVATSASAHVLQGVAYRLLLCEPLLPAISQAAAAGLSAGAAVSDGAAGGGAGGVPEVELPEYDGDDVAYITAGGVRPEMAPLLVPGDAAGASGLSARAYLTAWSLLLAHALELQPGSRGLAVLRQVLREAGHLVQGLLGVVVPQLGLAAKHAPGARGGGGGGAGGGKSGGVRGCAGPAATAAAAAGSDGDGWRLAEVLREVGLPSGRHAARATCRALYRAVLRALPATARGWFNDLRDRGLAAAVEAYTAAAEGPALLAAEMASVTALSRTASGGDGKFSVRASAAAREVVAVLEVDDGAVLELVVRLPNCLPLRAPEVECRRKVGVNETRLRKWLLSIATFLRYQDGSVAEAINLWKRNVDSEFEGVEACLICYSVISSVNAQLPRLVCRTCNVRFHPACLYKWFKSAGKSQCPHCQALW